MAPNSRHFQVGEIECVAVSDGTFSYPVGWLFSNVPKEQLENSLRERKLSTAHVESPYTCLLVKAKPHNLLIDTGADGLAPTTGNLLTNLKSEGISAAEITHVILTHGHPDHIGGVLGENGRLAFLNAQFFMSKIEWNFWNDPRVLHDQAMDVHMKELLVGCARKNLPPLKDRIELIDREREIVPGVQIMAAPGHTPGHVALLITSGKAQFLHMSDAVLHPLHLENPDWRNIFDLDEQAAVNTRQRLFERAAADRITTLAYHFPFPGLGRVKSQGRAFRWEAES